MWEFYSILQFYSPQMTGWIDMGFLKEVGAKLILEGWVVLGLNEAKSWYFCVACRKRKKKIQLQQPE